MDKVMHFPHLLLDGDREITKSQCQPWVYGMENQITPVSDKVTCPKCKLSIVEFSLWAVLI